MNTPAIFFDKSEKDRKKLSWYDWISASLSFIAQAVGGGSGPIQVLLISPLLVRKTEITQFGVFRYRGDLVTHSLYWKEISGVEVDRAQQEISVTGRKSGKTRSLSLVIKCSGSELDDVLALLTKRLPTVAGVKSPERTEVPAT